MTIQAVFENGVFRPLAKIDLPEHCRVEVDVREVHGAAPSEEATLKLREILSQRFASGQSDVAARHNEHQP